jgi:2-methylaconitate cis-trans-isomerase PrpF
MIDGTIVNAVVSDRAKKTGTVIIGHPSGTIDVDVEVGKQGNVPVLT